MGDSRKPVFSLMLRIPGTKIKHKVELYPGATFGNPDDYHCPFTRRYLNARVRYRVKVNGRWMGPKGKGKERYLITWYQFRDLLWRSMKGKITEAIEQQVIEQTKGLRKRKVRSSEPPLSEKELKALGSDK